MKAKWKPGWRTTEFWISAATLLVGATLTLRGYPEVGGLVLGGSLAQGVGYGRSRTELKRNRAEPRVQEVVDSHQGQLAELKELLDIAFKTNDHQQKTIDSLLNLVKELDDRVSKICIYTRLKRDEDTKDPF